MGKMPATQPSKSGEVPGEELMLFKEMPVVVSAARQAQPVNRLSTAASVVTEQDIHYSGLTNIPEVLQFAPAMDVARVNRNFYAVGVRGFQERYADRMITLIDGRLATNPAFGGTDWLSLPIMMEDIKRIEILRGPCGAAWGADALTGAVNIITKEPEETQGIFASTTWDQFGDQYNHLRWGAKAGKWAWRSSVGYSGQKSSEDTLDDHDIHANDFARRYIFDNKAAYQASKDTRYTFGLAGINDEMGSPDVIYVASDKNSSILNLRAFAKAEHQYDSETNGYVQWFGNYLDWKFPRTQEFRTVTNELEGQYNFVPAKDHKASIGSNLRWMNYNVIETTTSDATNPGDPFNEYWASIFGIDRWQVNKRLAIEGQLRGEYHPNVRDQVDWASRLTGLYNLDEKGDHVFRLSGAKAYRSPEIGWRRIDYRVFPLPSPPLPPDLYAINTLPNHDLKNEETWSIETGYTGRLAKPLTLNVNGYYQRYDNLIGLKTLPDPLHLGRMITQLRNLSGADSAGGEVELAYENKTGKISGWYAYNFVHPEGDFENEGIRAFLPSPHKFGLTGRLFLPHGFTLNANYCFNVAAKGDNVLQDIEQKNRLDLTATKEIGKNSELMFGVTDVLDRTEPSVLSESKFMHHDTPGRTFFVRFQIKF